MHLLGYETARIIKTVTMRQLRTESSDIELHERGFLALFIMRNKVVNIGPTEKSPQTRSPGT